MLRQYTGRQVCLTELPDSDKLRELAGNIKQHAIENLDYYLEQLVANRYRISPSSDRVGTRLEGAALPRLPTYIEQSRPMVMGALEVPRDGVPIGALRFPRSARVEGWRRELSSGLRL